MLSAASPTLETTWPTISLGSEIGQQISTLRPPGSIVATSPLEGGFIANVQIWSASDASSVPMSAPYGSNPTIADLLSHGSSFSTDGTANSWSGVPRSGGYVPRTIDAGGIDAEQSPATRPDPGDKVGKPQEGGTISIKSLLASMNPNIEKRHVESAAANSASKSLLQSEFYQRAEPPQAKLAVRAISGEWARAAVFEIAGGEPAVHSGQADNSHDRPVTTANQSAPAPEASPPIFFNSNSASTSRDAGDAAQTAPRQTTNGLPLPSSTLGDDLTAQSPANLRNERTSHINALAKPADLQTDEAVVAAFDQIGNGEVALPAPTADRLRLNGWLSGTPLLLMFALERVAAHNARRRHQTDSRHGFGR
jgi:hypothetical protein